MSIPAQDEDLSRVDDPTTDAVTLAQVAGRRHDLHGAIALHPNAGHDLLEWMRSQRKAARQDPVPVDTTVIHAMTMAERRRLAKSPETDPLILAALASDSLLVPDLSRNPSVPEASREAIYRKYPHLKPGHGPAARSDQESHHLGSADAAVAAFKNRQADANREHRAGMHTPSPPTERTNGLAIVSFVLSLIGGSVLAIVFGHVAQSQISRSGERGGGFATAGLVIGYLSLIVVIILAL